MSDRRTRIIERTRKLRERTTKRGCTEAEAIEAAQAVARLMEEYGLDDNDVEIGREDVACKSQGKAARDRLWPVVAHVTNCASVISAGRDGNRRIFYGRAPGPEIAVYLFTLLDRAIDRAIRDFRESQVYRRRRSPKTRAQAVAEFTVAMVIRLRYRLLDMFAATMNERPGPCP
ncbi:DUF7168 domain-containing protein [Methylobrevis pamukkalensis]|uniref:Uncharacterized protein n=1 Tax=Methylobrevis pamukkalensis TaxID=1439726 RepID=A0A1E3H4G1_9HYPH|nr:DUF2786 domain-containing protein [Methylobrevis pamukkalensis]ODN71200.1 hypothetical protein A6302_01489 [Methylobrevis pamukkalensis]